MTAEEEIMLLKNYLWFQKDSQKGATERDQIDVPFLPLQVILLTPRPEVGKLMGKNTPAGCFGEEMSVYLTLSQRQVKNHWDRKEQTGTSGEWNPIVT